MIKSSVSLCFVAIVLVFSLVSCSMPKHSIEKTEVDFRKPTDVQLTYKQNVMNTKISFSNDLMKLSVIDGSDAVSGLTFELDKTDCRILYSGMVNELSVDALSDTFFPLVIYNFISEFNGPVLTESYDTENKCSYVSRQVSGSFVTFEVFVNEENRAYSIHIT